MTGALRWCIRVLLEAKPVSARVANRRPRGPAVSHAPQPMVRSYCWVVAGRSSDYDGLRHVACPPSSAPSSFFALTAAFSTTLPRPLSFHKPPGHSLTDPMSKEALSEDSRSAPLLPIERDGDFELTADGATPRLVFGRQHQWPALVGRHGLD